MSLAEGAIVALTAVTGALVHLYHRQNQAADKQEQYRLQCESDRVELRKMVEELKKDEGQLEMYERCGAPGCPFRLPPPSLAATDPPTVRQ